MNQVNVSLLLVSLSLALSSSPYAYAVPYCLPHVPPPPNLFSPCRGGRFTPIYVFRRFDPYFSGHRGRMKGNGGEIRGKNSRIPNEIFPVGRLCEYGRFPGDRALQRGPTTWKPPSCFRQTAPQPRHFVISDTYFRLPLPSRVQEQLIRPPDPRNQRRIEMIVDDGRF